MRIEKFTGRYVEIIYQAADGRLTQRTIYVHSVRGGIVRAFCMTSRAPRTFHADSILAIQPVVRSA
jgi:predicted DNA-binding transcriptional regulator YafY